MLPGIAWRSGAARHGGLEYLVSGGNAAATTISGVTLEVTSGAPVAT
jgi:autotransporter passenger strand-loop-strand repeat protein